MQPHREAGTTQKERLIVLTDIGGEPDDSMSITRLLLYSNEIDVEGLVATTSVWMKNKSHPEAIREIVTAYGKVRQNLLLHAAGYPAADKLLSLVTTGQPGYGVGSTGDGKDTPGSELIVRALSSPDPRPVWVAAWGGVNTLAQALVQIRGTKPPEEVKRLVAKLRVYTISDQDDAGPWIRANFPDVFFIVSPGKYENATWTGINTVVKGIDNETISNEWIAKNIQQDHGPLGAAYPDVGWGLEGDTPTFLGLIPNGLNVPERPDFGGWGGRYELYTPSVGALGDMVSGGIPINPETRPIWSNAIDSYTPYASADYGRAMKPTRDNFTDFRVTLWRWRDDFQNDMAARMDWTVEPYAKANHPPVVKLAHPDQITVRSGEAFSLSGAGTTDPDGDSLSYLWFNYAEAGSWKTPIPPSGAENVFHATFKAPDVSKQETAHFILKVTDKGSPPLTRYKRVIVNILPK
ncbi:DUF1593 domain-containing protein [Sphingobium soli]|uniref:DUF1593 domain-containing protein n=1 Tax=Sphingobium soli TaxID=1591116 RepID=A0ABS8H7T0_9SPHN|nr:DUF1593 domain-containing protein [Sphingobium soli]